MIGRIDAEAAIVLNVQADLRYRDGTARSPPMSYGFISAPVDYLDLARNDAELLARMIEEAYVRTAGLIVDDLCAPSENLHQDDASLAVRPACDASAVLRVARTPILTGREPARSEAIP